MRNAAGAVTGLPVFALIFAASIGAEHVCDDGAMMAPSEPS
ncbi:MAG: hypothetical protein ABSH30_03845 [Acidimicrobiales bacterium]|jgi:hypothetical protein